MPADRKKLRRAVLIAALISVPCIAAGYYYFPRDIFVYVYNTQSNGPIVVKLNGETVIDQAAPVPRGTTDLPTYIGKKTVLGPDLDFYVRIPRQDPWMERLSAFRGTHVSVYIDGGIALLQQTGAPPLGK